MIHPQVPKNAGSLSNTRGRIIFCQTTLFVGVYMAFVLYGYKSLRYNRLNVYENEMQREKHELDRGKD
jgi:hypothetical protein